MFGNKKIAFFSSSFSNGGAERVMVVMASGLAARGYKIDFLVKINHGVYKEELHHNINLIDLKQPSSIKSIPQLIKYLRKTKPFLLYSTLGNLNNVSIICSTISSPHTKVVVSEANIIKNFEYRSISEKLIFWLSKLTYPFAFAHVGVSNDVSNDLRSVYGHKNIVTLYNPSFKENILHRAKENINHPFFETKLPIVISAGRIASQKDFSTLLKAFHLLQQYIDSRLLILGNIYEDDGEFSKLQSLVEKLELKQKVDFLGFVDNPFTYFFKSDVFVLSSKFEGFPNVLIQALACGLQVLSTDCPGGASEILSKGNFGYLTEVGDHVGMSRKIKKLIEKRPFKKKQMLKRARSFSQEKAIDVFVDTFLQI